MIKKNVKFTFLILICGFFIIIFLFNFKVDANHKTNLEEFISTYNKNCSYKYSGAILVAQGDEILLKKAYGYANHEEKILNKPDTIFPIASITKSFTSIAIMQLQERGLLNVDDKISKYINGSKWEKEITIHHLLTHTSGLPKDGLFLGQSYVSLEKNIEHIKNYSLWFEPGPKYSYSNAGYQILAAIIEKVSGESYNNYIKNNIFLPLRMNNSKGGTDSSYGENQAIGYQILTKEASRLSIYNFSCITGSGNIYSNVEDLYKYERGIADCKILSKNSINEIFSIHWGEGNSGYGYGWNVTERYNYKKYSHSGNIGGGGYNSLMIRYPEKDYVLIFLTNNADTTALNVVVETMEAIIFNKDYVLPQKAKGVEIDDDILKRYAGKYKIMDNVIIPIDYRDGKLYTIADDGKEYELIPLNNTQFYYKNREYISSEFILNDEKNEVILIIKNTTRSFKGVKIK